MSPFEIVNSHSSPESSGEANARRIKVKLLLDKATNRILCLQAKEDFADLLLSFLTFPLGSIMTLLKGHISMGSVDNLYKSVADLRLKHFASQICKDSLLNPKIPFGFRCGDLPLVEVGECFLYHIINTDAEIVLRETRHVCIPCIKSFPSWIQNFPVSL